MNSLTGSATEPTGCNGDVLYAAYGSNLHPARLRARVPSALLLGRARIRGWALRFHKRGQDGSAKCNIVAADEAVHVAIYSLNHSDKQRLDRIEGVGRGYRVMTLEVPGNGRCHTYVAQDDHIDAGLRPFCWYRELVLRGAVFHAFPADYVGAIAAHAALRDRDEARHLLHMTLACSADAQRSSRRRPTEPVR